MHGFFPLYVQWKTRMPTAQGMDRGIASLVGFSRRRHQRAFSNVEWLLSH